MILATDGNLKDSTMEALADHGNEKYASIDSQFARPTATRFAGGS